MSRALPAAGRVVFSEQHPPKLSEAVGRMFKHGQNRESIGKRERNLRLSRDQRSLDRVRLMPGVGTTQPPDQLKGAVVGDVQPGETHTNSRNTAIGNSGLRYHSRPDQIWAASSSVPPTRKP